MRTRIVFSKVLGQRITKHLLTHFHFIYPGQSHSGSVAYAGNRTLGVGPSGRDTHIHTLLSNKKQFTLYSLYTYWGENRENVIKVTRNIEELVSFYFKCQTESEWMCFKIKSLYTLCLENNAE